MGKVTGFIEFKREAPQRRPVVERVHDWQEVYLPFDREKLQKQGARCMDCGIPFCHEGCPLGNLIPDWNDLVYRNRWREAIDRLHATNNFPEFTGRLCPAPCEGSCVLGINDDPVTIKQVEVGIIEHAFDEGWVTAAPPAVRTGKQVAVVGSGPAGLAAAEQLNRAGHLVTVFEKADRIGGLLRYGIPEFKMEKRFLTRRLALMEAGGISFRTKADVGVTLAVEAFRAAFDAVVLAGGAEWPRDLQIPGRELAGIHFAMDYLTLQNRRCEGDLIPDGEFITASDKNVIIIGGGDTGADCLGTVHRQGARSVTQFEILPRPPDERDPASNPWPLWPNIFRVSAAHEEGGVRIPDDALLLVADRIRSNIRDLEGCLVRLLAVGALTHQEISLELAEEVLQDYVNPEPDQMTPERILAIVAENFSVKSDALCGSRRTHDVVLPRQVAMYLARTLTDLSLVEIGRIFGNRDHSTVVYACEKVGAMISADSAMADRINGLISTLSSV